MLAFGGGEGDAVGQHVESNFTYSTSLCIRDMEQSS